MHSCHRLLLHTNARDCPVRGARLPPFLNGHAFSTRVRPPSTVAFFPLIDFLAMPLDVDRMASSTAGLVAVSLSRTHVNGTKGGAHAPRHDQGSVKELTAADVARLVRPSGKASSGPKALRVWMDRVQAALAKAPVAAVQHAVACTRARVRGRV